jgi:predicted transglutaminase-like cysteine proteinase
VGSVDRPAAYARFCQNSPSLCMPAASAPDYTGYIQFCQNSPVLCTAAPKPPDPGYVKFCHNSPVLCTGVRPANPATAGVRSSERPSQRLRTTQHE